MGTEVAKENRDLMQSKKSKTEKPLNAQEVPVVITDKTIKNYPFKQSTLAVLQFVGREGISENEAFVLTDRFRTELDKLNLHKLITRSKMKEILEMQNFSRTVTCNASECAVEAGQLLGTEYMIYGSIARIGNLYTINTYLVSIETGEMVASAPSDIEGGVEKLLTNGMRKNVVSLIESANRDSAFK